MFYLYDCVYCAAIFCRDELKRHYTLGEYWIEVEMEDLASFDEDLSDCLYKLPTENLPLVSLNTHTFTAVSDNGTVTCKKNIYILQEKTYRNVVD